MTSHVPHDRASVAQDHQAMVLDGTKIGWYLDRVQARDRGERIAPITIDMALTRACNASCSFCYAQLQENDRAVITADHMTAFLDDSARMGVKGISLVSDGESTISPAFEHTLTYGASLGLSMAVGTNAYAFKPDRSDRVLEALTYIRVNFSAGRRDSYSRIMGLPGEAYDRVVANVRYMVRLEHKLALRTTIGLQMVLMPDMADEIIPFAVLGRDLGVDYAVIKHCSDDEYGHLGIDYGKYAALTPLLEEAEAMSTNDYKVVVKWTKLRDGNHRSYQRCYGPPFLIQMSGSGLVAPCGMLFNARYAKFHVGNSTEDRWWDIWQSDRYWEVMDYLGSDQFDAQRMCGSLCIQHLTNAALDNHAKGDTPITAPTGPEPLHVSFI